MQSIEPRNEQLMLRQFWKKHPTYNLNAMMRRRYEELMDAKAFNEWLANRRLKQEGEEYADAMGRVTEAVNRRVPQLRWAGAERQQVLRAGDQMVRNTMESGVVPGFVPAQRPRPRAAASGDVLGYIEEGEPVNLPLPNRRASQFVQSHFYLDDLPQSTEPLDENPRPHSELGARIEDDFVSADEGYQGRPFPQMRRPSFLGPGPETDSESGPDEAFRRDGFNAPRPPPAAPSSSVSGRLGEAALRGGEAIIAAGATGVGQAVERFGFRNAERAAAQVEQRVLPRIIGRPADAEQLIIRAGQRAQDVERAAAADIERFAAEQAAAEGGELAPLLAEAGTQTAAEAAAAEAAGGGILEGLAAAGGAAAETAGTAAAAAFPIAEGLGMAAGVATGGVAALAGGAAYGLYQGGRWLLSGNGGDAASSSGGEFQDLRTLNNMQQGTPQERFSVQQPRVQQPA
eukprot:s7423_g6.t1